MKTVASTRREFLQMAGAGAVGLAVPSLAPAATELERTKRIDPPALLKLIVLVRAAIAEGEALLEAHGGDCGCSSCWDVEGTRWVLERVADSQVSSTCLHHKKEAAEVEAVRGFMTRRLGSSAIAGNGREKDAEFRKRYERYEK